MSAPRVGVLALQGDVREHLQALDRAGGWGVPVRRPEDLRDLDGIVLPGGESTAMGRLLEVFDVLSPLRAAVAAGLPAYGSCAGLILLAETVLDGLPGQATIGGLDVCVRRNAFGRQVESFECDLVMSGLGGGPLHAVFIRAPWVERTGPGVEVLARVEHASPEGSPAPAAGRVVAVRQGALLATAFHPELTPDGRVHGLFLDMVKEARG